MSLISITPVTDGATATAASVNNPLNTIVNDYNGGILDANIAANAAIALTKLGITVSTQANAGSAGGTLYWINFGGIKLLWGVGAVQTVGGAGSTAQVFTLPAFFTTLQYVNTGVSTVSLDNGSYTTGFAYSTSSIETRFQSKAGMTFSVNVFAIGT